MGAKAMTYEEAARILDPETNLEALAPYAGDCEARQAAIVEACRMGARALCALSSSEPLTAEQLKARRGKWVWIVSPDKDLTVSGWAYVGNAYVFTYCEYERDALVGRAVYNICDYGAWLAYAAPPVCIDCEALQPEPPENW